MIKHVLMVSKFDPNGLDEEKQGIFIDAENFAHTLMGIVNSTYHVESFAEGPYVIDGYRMNKRDIEENWDDEFGDTTIPEKIAHIVGESSADVYPDNYDAWPNATLGFANIDSGNKLYAPTLVTAFEVNALQKIAHAIIFPELEVNENTLSVTGGIVKAYEDNKKVALNLIKKGLIRHKDADEMYRRGISDAVEKHATKFVKAHKADFVFKQPALICKVPAYSPVLALASTLLTGHGMLLDFDDCRNMYQVKLIVRGYNPRSDVYEYGDERRRGEFFCMTTAHSFVSSYAYNQRNDGTNISKVVNIIAANIIDGRGLIEPVNGDGKYLAGGRYSNFNYFITEDELHDFIRVTKRVLEGKYVFKVKNGADGFFNVLEDGTVKLIKGQLYLDTTVTKDEKEENTNESCETGTVSEGEETD